jgi:hypothetical protein
MVFICACTNRKAMKLIIALPDNADNKTNNARGIIHL